MQLEGKLLLAALKNIDLCDAALHCKIVTHMTNTGYKSQIAHQEHIGIGIGLEISERTSAMSTALWC